ncbi:hypothetical protein KDL01_12990 [Actinospica durhamensis]|uniref:Uncharacterized protein n=1 Tax=Actinospica durhamensis TaxID=1508375 RepID=A0A941EUL1_9ACTN|nr:hypothetical protein [Actinospica durhamensis]MBR7834184.1 hypothetical protein [Actinospica durhamensis]
MNTGGPTDAVTHMTLMTHVIAAISASPGCEVTAARSHTGFQPQADLVEPAQLRELRAACSRIRLHTESEHGWVVHTSLVHAGPVLLGEPTASQIHAESPEDLTNGCYVLATDASCTAAGFHVVVDLHPDRAGHCYLTSWDTFGLVGEMPTVGNDIAQTLIWLLTLGGGNPLEALPLRGDAYDFGRSGHTAG